MAFHLTELRGRQVERIADALEGMSNDNVKVSPQELTEAQKTQARTNIGAAASASLDGFTERLQADEAEIALRAKSVNNVEADSTGNIRLDLVPFADNLYSGSDMQSSFGTFVTRTTGGDASISDGNAWVKLFGGNYIHEGYSPRSVTMTVNPVMDLPRDGTITAELNRNIFVASVHEDSIINLSYSHAWSVNPEHYGITVAGTPVNGDKIDIDYTKEILTSAVTAVTRPTPAGLSVSIDNETFIAYVEGQAGTYSTLYNTSSWSTDPTLYGLTVTGTPEDGDNIIITYDGRNSPTVAVSSPRTADDPIRVEISRTEFISYVSVDSDITFTYTSSWDKDPSLYGISVYNTPLSGDTFTVHYVKEIINMTVTAVQSITRENPIYAVIDKEVYDNAISSNGTKTFSYTTTWSENPANYGITVYNNPANGDQITVVCTKEVRGTITPFSATDYYSTGWNLYNHTKGYARTLKYNEQYNFLIGGAFTSLAFSTSSDPDAVKTPITTTASGDYQAFSVPDDGFVWVTGGDSTSTFIVMTWSDWTSGPPDGYAAHTASTINLSSVLNQLFPNGMMRVGDVYDELNLTSQDAYQRIERLPYSLSTIQSLRTAGRAYVYDENYIYAVLVTPIVSSIELNGDYIANDHGLEVFTDTIVPGYVQMAYGQNLKDKLRTDVVTISPMDLNATQKKQVRKSIGAVSAVNGNVPNENGEVSLPVDNTPTSNSQNFVTSGGVKNELDALASRIGNVESPASVFQDITFSIPTSGWTGSSTFAATVQSSSITATSGIWVFYDSSYNNYAAAPITAEKYTGGVTFTSSAVPTGAISGYIRIVDSVNGIIPVARGGTGADNATTARTNLGAASASDVEALYYFENLGTFDTFQQVCSAIVNYIGSETDVSLPIGFRCAEAPFSTNFFKGIIHGSATYNSGSLIDFAGREVIIYCANGNWGYNAVSDTISTLNSKTTPSVRSFSLFFVFGNVKDGPYYYTNSAFVPIGYKIDESHISKPANSELNRNGCYYHLYTTDASLAGKGTNIICTLVEDA